MSELCSVAQKKNGVRTIDYITMGYITKVSTTIFTFLGFSYK